MGERMGERTVGLGVGEEEALEEEEEEEVPKVFVARSIGDRRCCLWGGTETEVSLAAVAIEICI